MTGRNQTKSLMFTWEKNQAHFGTLLLSVTICWGNLQKKCRWIITWCTHSIGINWASIFYVSGARRGAGKTPRPIKHKFWQKEFSLLWRHTVHAHYLQILCEFAYSLKFTCNFKINTLATLCHLPIAPYSKKLESPTCIFLAEVSLGRVLPCCFSSHTVNNRPFCDLLSAMFSTLLCFILVISLFKTDPHIVLSC